MNASDTGLLAGHISVIENEQLCPLRAIHDGTTFRSMVSATDFSETTDRSDETVEREFVARKAGRYPLRLPVQFSWRDDQGARRSSKGFTRDIGRSGSFIVADECPQLGANLKYQITMEYPDGIQGVGLVLDAAGRVIRCELMKDTKLHGFAVLGNRFVCRRASATSTKK